MQNCELHRQQRNSGVGEVEHRRTPDRFQTARNVHHVFARGTWDCSDLPKSHCDYSNVHLLSLRRIQHLLLLLHHTHQKVSFSIQHTQQQISTRGKCVNDSHGHSQLTMAQPSFYSASKQWFQFFVSRSVKDHRRLLRAQFFIVIASHKMLLTNSFLWYKKCQV